MGSCNRAKHRVVACGGVVVAVAWVGACLTCVVVVNVETMRVAIVPILKAFDRIGWWLYTRRVHCTLLLVRIAATIIVVGVVVVVVATIIVVLVSIVVVTVIWIEIVAPVVGIAIAAVVLVHGWTVLL